MPERFWEIVREEAFEEELLFLIADAREADDFVEGAEYVLARDPRAGRFIGGEPELWFRSRLQCRPDSAGATPFLSAPA